MVVHSRYRCKSRYTIDHREHYQGRLWMILHPVQGYRCQDLRCDRLERKSERCTSDFYSHLKKTSKLSSYETFTLPSVRTIFCDMFVLDKSNLLCTYTEFY